MLPSLKETGLRGAAALDVAAMASALERYRATTAIFSPQTLQGLVEYIEAGGRRPSHLRFGAVGGAPVSARLLARARKLRLPIHEGYGLSECASVTTLNTPAASREGSVGRPLPHVRLRIADDGEVLVAGNLFAGYLGEAQTEREWWHTGDLGYLDVDGFLYLTGRRRNLFITAYGRNVAPEWVERELVLDPLIAQAAVFGEARPWNVAVLVSSPDSGAVNIAAAVARRNAELPDYARVRRWIVADEPFAVTNGELSGTGRVRRHAVYRRYRERIESLYQQEHAS